MIVLKNIAQIDNIRKSCSIVGYVLKELKKEIVPGVKTSELNKIAEDLCYSRGATPGFKNYKGFPYSLCVSVNEEVVHGFPSERVLLEGDIVSVDFGALYKGWYGDAAFTAGVGKISQAAEKIISVCKECLSIGISKAAEFGRVGDISEAIQTKAEMNNFVIIKDLVGHGVGKNLHEEPQIANFGNINTGYLLKSGMVIAIEPIITTLSDDIDILDDSWTVVTKHKNISAHFEHTIVLGDGNVEILTKN